MVKEKVSITGKQNWFKHAFGSSLTYTRNRSGPRIDPWGTPQVTYLGSVSLFSLISMYCFLLDK